MRPKRALNGGDSMDNFAEMTVNAVVYIYFVALFGGLGLVTAALIGWKLFNRLQERKERKTPQKRHKVA